MLRDCSNDPVQYRIVSVPHHPQALVAVVNYMRQGLLIPPTMSALRAGDLLVATCLYRSHGKQVKPGLVNEAILIKGQECTLRRLKTYLRSTMTQCRLNNILLLHCHKETPLSSTSTGSYTKLA